MYEFVCASPVCRTRFTAPTRAEVMTGVAKHFADDHHVPNPSRSIVEFLEANTVRAVSP